MSERDSYLTDEQYEACLKKIKERVEDPDFKPWSYDCDAPGEKDTNANFGFCDRAELSKIDGVKLWPDKDRDAIKYRKANQKCPFDCRTDEEAKRGLGWGNGCYFKCGGHHARPQTAVILRAVAKRFYDGRGES